MTLLLRPPTRADESSCRALHEALEPEGFEFLLSDGSWDEILVDIEREAAGVDLPRDRVRAEWLVAEEEGVVVGRVSIRYWLTPFLLEVGGHVGYAVGPAFRRRGFATEILRQSLVRLRDAGVLRVLVTCDDTNVASAATIERCAGVLEDIRMGPTGAKRRYWIEA